MSHVPNDRTDDAYDRMGQSVTAFLGAWDAEKAADAADRGASSSLDALGIVIRRCVAVFWDKYPHADLDEVCRSVEVGLTHATDDWHESRRSGAALEKEG